jgi:hypothetical protein
MSSLTVAMAFMQRVYAEPSSGADNYLSTVSATLGVFLLTISLVEWGARTGAIAEALHQNAEKLNSFHRKVGVTISTLTGGGSLTWNEVQSLNDQYDAIKADCQYNHSPLDDAYFRSHHLFAPELPKGNPGPAMDRQEILSVKLKWHLSSLLYIAAIWIFLILLLLPLRFESMWKVNKPEGPKGAAIAPSAATQNTVLVPSGTR